MKKIQTGLLIPKIRLLRHLLILLGVAGVVTKGDPGIAVKAVTGVDQLQIVK
jgi:hypothetical protein